MLNPSYLLLGLFVLFLSSCKTSTPDSEIKAESLANCSGPISLQDYLQAKLECVAEGYFANAAEAAKRRLHPWVPCNQVSWVDGSNDLFGPNPNDPEASVEASRYKGIYKDWLGSADRFDRSVALAALSNLDAASPEFEENPIVKSAHGQAVQGMIRQAQHNIIMDIFLFGGSWGAAIARELAQAANRGVEVILIHDNVSKFNVANEMDPLWEVLQDFASKHPRMVAIDANVRPPQKVSSIPFGLERLTGLFAGLADLTVAADGRSDHSKIIITDALFTNGLDDYLNLNPSAFISSRNMVDSAASFYHDEAVIIKGPGALVAAASYRSDIFWAFEQAKTQNKVNADDKKLLENSLKKLDQMIAGPVKVKAQGSVAVQPLEVSPNEELRNADVSILSKLAQAKLSIDLYGKIAYNWPLAIALKEAMARGVKVRVILDQQTASSALMNAALPYMIMTAPRQDKDGRETKQVLIDGKQLRAEAELPIRWFLPFRPGFAFNKPERSNLAQEIHAKTILIDGRLGLFGSTNMDTFTWAGGFREYSVWVEDSALVSQSAQLFDRLWSQPFLTVPHAVWMGATAPDPKVLAALTKAQQASGCDIKSELCDFSKALQGGQGYSNRSPFRELIKQITQNEAERIKAVFPKNFRRDAGGEVLCQ